jgi:hypothetical protein
MAVFFVLAKLERPEKQATGAFRKCIGALC